MATPNAQRTVLLSTTLLICATVILLAVIGGAVVLIDHGKDTTDLRSLINLFLNAAGVIGAGITFRVAHKASANAEAAQQTAEVTANEAHNALNVILDGTLETRIRAAVAQVITGGTTH